MGRTLLRKAKTTIKLKDTLPVVMGSSVWLWTGKGSEPFRLPGGCVIATKQQAAKIQLYHHEGPPNPLRIFECGGQGADRDTVVAFPPDEMWTFDHHHHHRWCLRNRDDPEDKIIEFSDGDFNASAWAETVERFLVQHFGADSAVPLSVDMFD